MSEFGNPFDFTELEDDGLDIAAIFGGTDAAEAPPTPEPASTPEETGDAEPEAEQAGQAAPADAQPTAQEAAAGDKNSADGDSEPDLFAALTPKNTTAQKPAKTAQEAPKQVSLFDKPPVFSYGGSKEEIKDSSMTFEELRIAKADDFPELAEGKKVSWSVTYGKTTKYISDPKGTTIASIKEEIEKSKAFLDALKKAKDKERNRSRQLCHSIFYQMEELIYIDSGNGEHTGQVVCGIRSGGRTLYQPIGKAYVRFCGGELLLSSFAGRYRTHVALDGRSEIIFGFDLRHMKDALEQFRQEDQVKIKVASKYAPFVIEAAGRRDFAMVCPVRLKEEQAA